MNFGVGLGYALMFYYKNKETLHINCHSVITLIPYTLRIANNFCFSSSFSFIMYLWSDIGLTDQTAYLLQDLRTIQTTKQSSMSCFLSPCQILQQWLCECHFVWLGRSHFLPSGSHNSYLSPAFPVPSSSLAASQQESHAAGPKVTGW